MPRSPASTKNACNSRTARSRCSKRSTARIKSLLVSGGFTFFTTRLKDRLGLDFVAANTLEVENDTLTGTLRGEILDAQAKTDWLVKTRDALGLMPEQVVAMGDCANDLKMMAVAGVSIAYRAKPVVRAQASYALNHTALAGVLPLLGAV